jgi:hypothetical protein
MGSVILWLRSVNLPFLPVPGWFNEEDRSGRRSEWNPSASATFLFFRQQEPRARSKRTSFQLALTLSSNASRYQKRVFVSSTSPGEGDLVLETTNCREDKDGMEAATCSAGRRMRGRERTMLLMSERVVRDMRCQD